MAKQLGTLLWGIRMTSGLSQGKLAEKAGVSKSVISQWEADKRQPRSTELDAVLDALGATSAQRFQVYTCIDAPRAIRYLRQSEPALGPMPVLSDLLRAMRLRKGWTQEQTAAHLGVDRTTVVRWEQGNRIPSNEQMQALCFALDAREREVVALTTGQGLSAPAPLASLTVGGKGEWIDRKLDDIFWQVNGQETVLWELEFLILEREVWSLASRDATLRPLLAKLYAFHAASFQNQRRWSEAGTLAQRALDLIPRQEQEPDYILRAAITMAAVAVNVGVRPFPERGIQFLQNWLSRAASPIYVAWMQSDTSKYLMQAGQVNHALDLARRAWSQAVESADATERYLRQMDYGRLSLQAGQPHAALAQLPEPVLISPSQYAYDLLTHAEAHLRVGEISAAHDWTRQALERIEEHALDHLRAQLEALTRQF